MIIKIRKRGKRNKTTYSIIGVYCEIGHLTLHLLFSNGKIKTFNRHELDICEMEIIHTKPLAEV